MVKEAMDVQLTTSENLLILHSDETWIWSVIVSEIDDVVDNSFITVAAAEFASFVARYNGKDKESEKYRKIAESIRKATDRLLFSKERGRYAVSRDSDGVLDETPMTDVLCRPTIVGYKEAREKDIFLINMI